MTTLPCVAKTMGYKRIVQVKTLFYSAVCQASCLCILEYMYTCICVYVYECANVYMYTCIRVYIYTSTCLALTDFCQKTPPEHKVLTVAACPYWSFS